MNKETTKALVAVIADEIRESDNTCCCLRGGVCEALTDTEFINQFTAKTCGTVGCPFFKPSRDMIRVGNKFFTEREWKEYQNIKLTVEKVNKWVDDLDAYALDMIINLDNASYDRGVRAGISYAVDYMTRKLRQIKVKEHK